MNESISFWQAIAIVVVPLLFLVVPGKFLVSVKSLRNLLGSAVDIFVVSIATWTLGAMLFVALGASLPVVYALIALSSLALIWKRKTELFSMPTLWYALAITIPILITYSAFTVPFLRIHDGLPTGDSQKAIFWAQDVIDHGTLPDYSRSQQVLNRDPVDFYTPGLHVLIASVMDLSPAPLTSVGLFSIVLAIAVAFLAAAMIKELFDDYPHVVPPLLAALFVLTNFRFLRYIREPGYHLQNLLGEFFLFATIYYGLRFIKKKNTKDVVLGIVSAVSLIFTHQFSAFVAAFAVAALLLAIIVKDRKHIQKFFWRHVAVGVGLAVTVVCIAIGGFLLGLHEKIPHIFSSDPHLLPLVRPVTDYPLTMGVVWFLSGIAGLVLMVWQAKKHQAHYEAVWAFFAVTIVLLLLSQGPRIFIDIPPVRALLYSVVPLSVTAAYFFAKILHVIKAQRHMGVRYAMMLLWVAALMFPIWTSVQKAFAIGHSVRTNSTLTPQQLTLSEYIARTATDETQAILIDDYNRRSASWLLLSGQPMYTRIAADIQRQMDEASQSQARQQLYLTLLDYEKIYSLGSKPEITHLLQKHSIQWLTGIEGSTNSALAHNPSVRPVAYGGDVVLYSPVENMTCALDSRCAWLLRASTLVNDIGDDQDTFEHLPASIRTARLSSPQVVSGTTYRTTTAPVIPLRFNVGDFVSVLWDREHTTRSDIALEFAIEFAIPPSEQVQLATSTGAVYPIPADGIVRMQPKDVVFEDDGFVTLYLQNDSAQLVAIDMIALGLSHVP